MRSAASLADESTADESTLDDSMADEWTLDDSMADESTQDDSMADESMADESKAYESMAHARAHKTIRIGLCALACAYAHIICIHKLGNIEISEKKKPV